jgi:hypothetical protein
VFPDVFFALESGQAALDLDEDSFDPGLTNLQFKWAALQAVDDDGDGVAGVAVRIARADTGFARDGTTRDDGFSEDLDAPLDVLDRDQRFPLLGRWQLSLADPGQFAQLGDLRLFVMYAFEER